jgi:hypothetical protein
LAENPFNNFLKFLCQFMIVLLTKVRVSVANSTPEVSRYPEVPKYPPAKRSVRFNSSGTVTTVSVEKPVLIGLKKKQK